MERKIKPISQILIYIGLNYSGVGIKKSLVSTINNIYGALEEKTNILHLCDKNKEYIGMIDLKSPNTIIHIVWDNKESD